MHPHTGGRPLIRLCASNQSQNTTHEGKRINVWDHSFLFLFLFLTPVIHKLLCKRLSRVILAGLVWTQWLGHHWKQLQFLEYFPISLEVWLLNMCSLWKCTHCLFIVPSGTEPCWPGWVGWCRQNEVVLPFLFEFFSGFLFCSVIQA